MYTEVGGATGSPHGKCWQHPRDCTSNIFICDRGGKGTQEMKQGKEYERKQAREQKLCQAYFNS